MVHERMAFEPAQRLDANAAVFAYPSQVVAHEIDDHDVFRLVLEAGAQLEGEAFVLGERFAARPGSLDRTRFNFTLSDAHESLRGRTGDDLVAEIEVAGERGGIAHAQFFVEF